MRLAALSVDIDDIPCYTAIHGLEAPDEERARAIYERALPRFGDLFADEGVPATFFVIGRDVEVGDNQATLGALAAAGHELANHSEHHRYDLTRRSRDEIRDDIRTGGERLRAITGEAPKGFRAPGYTIDDTVFEVLEELDYDYDSSVFPCPAYYGAKTAAIGLIAARGRRSRSVVDDARVLLAPADPYRVGRPYWRRGTGMLELPIAVTRAATGRLPYIGTSVALSGEVGADLLTRAMAGRPLVNLELHGIDLSDAKMDGLEFLAPHQPDLSKTYAQKAAALRAAIRRLRKLDYEFVTLAEAARRLG